MFISLEINHMFEESNFEKNIVVNRASTKTKLL